MVSISALEIRYISFFWENVQVQYRVGTKQIDIVLNDIIHIMTGWLISIPVNWVIGIYPLARITPLYYIRRDKLVRQI